MTSITKTFGKTRALTDASLTVRRNTIHALLGENGAGKTTLMRIAFGMIAPDAGTIVINGDIRQFKSSADAIAAGIGMVHQHFTLVPAMTVAENIALGGRGRYNTEQAHQFVRTLSQQTGLSVNPSAVVNTLPVGAQQRVEILKALAKDATILILDEPTAVLAPDESRELLTKIRSFAETQGSAILITHKLRDAIEFADDVTVLRRGETVFTGSTEEVDETKLAAAMIGSKLFAISKTLNDPSETTQRPEFAPHPPSTSNNHRTKPRDVFRLRHVHAVDARNVETVKDVSLSVHNGEILGIAAVEGNGQYELLRILAGRLSPSAGFVEIPDTVGFIPEDRHRDALILDSPLYENIALFGAADREGVIPWNTLRQTTAVLMETYDVRAPNPNTPAASLSGGNQQKLVVGREIHGAPQGIVAENPTRGLDIQATQAVHQRLLAAREQGAAIIVYSSDLDEVMELADRIVVMYAGTLLEVPKDREAIGHAMLTGIGT
jgi:ABC-type uncharacterized transport system ATPase subunit